jgi:hypothetical protein
MPQAHAHDHPRPADAGPRTRRPAATWAAARRDYGAGVSTAVIGERYGLAARSVRRRAALEQWPRPEAAPPPVEIRRQRLEAALQALPELADVSAVRGEDLSNLLLLPDPAGLCRYAFRRAAECAALDGPREAAVWLRVARLSEGVGARMDVAVRPFSPADYLRASMIASMTGDDDADIAEESPVSGSSPEIRGGPDSGR